MYQSTILKMNKTISNGVYILCLLLCLPNFVLASVSQSNTKGTYLDNFSDNQGLSSSTSVVGRDGSLGLVRHNW
ncbi:MAG: hypothetical protein AAB465_00150, partial [Patescibacteria group bacterium]